MLPKCMCDNIWLFERLSLERWVATLVLSTGWGTFALKFVIWVMAVGQISVLGMGGGVLGPPRTKVYKSVLWVGVFWIDYVLGTGDAKWLVLMGGGGKTCPPRIISGIALMGQGQDKTSIPEVCVLPNFGTNWITDYLPDTAGCYHAQLRTLYMCESKPWRSEKKQMSDRHDCRRRLRSCSRW